MQLLAYHVYCWVLLKAFAEDRNTRSHRFYRVLNKLPVFVLIGVVVLVIAKPF